MKNIFYVMIPAVAILLIFLNMMYGHLLFGPTEQVANKYSIYVHLQPEWKSSNKNILFDVTNSWYKEQSQKTTSIDSTYNENQLQYLDDKSFVELKHSFSNCEDEWQPILYRRAIDTVRHEFEYVQGLELSADPSISIYPDVNSKSFDKKNVYVQFIPICTLDKTTSYNYSIKTDNDDIGFDVYFVSSQIFASDYYADNFIFNQNEGCFTKNKQSYSGTCSNIENGGGLLLVLPDNLKPWLTKVTVNLYEIEKS